MSVIEPMESEYYLERFKALALQLVEHKIATPLSIGGCTDAEIKHLESRLSISLPLSYQDFLMVMGKSAGTL